MRHLDLIPYRHRLRKSDMNNKLICPCEECISFAICYNIEQIKCEALYRFVSRTSYFMHNGKKQELYIEPLLDTDEIIYQVYNRFLEGTTLPQYKVLLTRNRNMARTQFSTKHMKEVTTKKLKGVFSHDQ